LERLMYANGAAAPGRAPLAYIKRSKRNLEVQAFPYT